MHTDPSITLLEQETERLYAQLRNFADHVSPSFETYELKREVDARRRAKQRRDAKAATAVPRKGKEMEVPPAAGGPLRPSAVTRKGKEKEVPSIASDPPRACADSRKGKEKEIPSVDTSDPPHGPQLKQYHLKTVKHHFLPDYPNIIREFGTTDSYSTEPVRSFQGPNLLPLTNTNLSQSSSTRSPYLGMVARVASM